MKHKIKYIIQLFFLLHTTLVFSQEKITVFDLLNIEKRNCPLVNYSFESEDRLEGVAGNRYYWDEGESNEKISDADVLISFSSQIKDLQNKLLNEYALTIQSAKAYKFIFTNKNYLYKENGLYGLKDAAEKIIIAPIFDHIGDVDSTGFSAYLNGYSSYYNSDGIKIISGSYFSVKKVTSNAFLIQSIDGYGVVDVRGDVLISPVHSKIDIIKSFGTVYFRVCNESPKGYLINETGKDTLWISLLHEPQIFCPGIWIYSGYLYDINKKEQLICQSSFSIEGLSPSLKTIAIRKFDHTRRSELNDYYLSDVEGNLITDKVFSHLYYLKESNLYAASVKVKLNDNSKQYVDKFALLDTNGNWLFDPIYSAVADVGDSIFVASTYDRTYRIIKKNGSVVLPFDYTEIRETPIKNLLLCTQKDGLICLIDGSTGEIKQTNMPFNSLFKVSCAGTFVYIANDKGKEFLVDSTFKRITPNFNRVFYGDLKKGIFEGMTCINNPDGTYSGNNTVSYFDYKGKAISFRINKKTYTSVRAGNFITDDLKHIYINDVTKEGYFIYQNTYLTSAPYHWQAIETANNKETYVVMEYGGKRGLINKKGEFLIPPVFQYISPFDSITRRASYSYGPEYNIKGYITEDGRFLFGSEYVQTIDLGLNLFAVKKNNLWGVVTLDNKIIVPINFTYVTLTGGLIQTVDGSGSRSLVNVLGKKVR